MFRSVSTRLCGAQIRKREPDGHSDEARADNKGDRQDSGITPSSEGDDCGHDASDERQRSEPNSSSRSASRTRLLAIRFTRNPTAAGMAEGTPNRVVPRRHEDSEWTSDHTKQEYYPPLVPENYADYRRIQSAKQERQP